MITITVIICASFIYLFFSSSLLVFTFYNILSNNKPKTQLTKTDAFCKLFSTLKSSVCIKISSEI